MGIFDIETLENHYTKKDLIIQESVDISDYEDELPDWFSDFQFNNKLIINANSNLHKLPRNMENCSLFIGGQFLYTTVEERENLEGLPGYIRKLHVQSSVHSTKGLMGVSIKDSLTLAVNKITDFYELPSFEEKLNTNRVSLIGLYKPQKFLDVFYKSHPEMIDFKGSIEKKIQYLCEKDYTQQILDSF